MELDELQVYHWTAVLMIVVGGAVAILIGFV